MLIHTSSLNVHDVISPLVNSWAAFTEKARLRLSGVDALLHASRTPVRLKIWLPRSYFVEEIGLGDAIKKISSAIGISPCGSCERRALTLNHWAILSSRRSRQNMNFTADGRPYWTDTNGCWHFDGACTGGFWWYRRQCITAPSSQLPDATTVEQCCHNWFRYPWIKVCPSSLDMGCGVCVA